VTQPSGVVVRVRRRIRLPPDLTSLFDVLFIVVFVALIRAAAAQQAAETPPPPVEPKPEPKPAPQPPQPPPDVAALRTRALATFGAELASRTPLVIRVAVALADDADAVARTRITAIEADGKRVAVDVALLELSADADIEVAYLGERSADQRLCRVASLRLGVPNLARYLVIVSPDRPLSDGKYALRDGILRDLDRCYLEQRGLATIVPPAPPEPPKKTTTPDKKP
jgi:hypothetical protein